MPDTTGPKVYSIAAHRGFADALVAGLVPRFSEPEFGLARLTLLLPSGRAVRTMSEAFIRHSGAGLLMPRMAVVGDLDLDETLGPILDPLGAGSLVEPAADTTRRWLRLAEIIREEGGDQVPKGGALLRLAFDMGRTMDRLLVEEIRPEELYQERVLGLLGDMADNWKKSLRLFMIVQDRWMAELAERGELDPAGRRNKLFHHAARRWRANPPLTPIVAAGVTSAAKGVANLLKTVAQLPQGSVVLPDLDLSMSADVWDELGSAGAADADPPLARGDAVTHPQYHLKLLLNRMGVSREEVQPWHRAGMGKGPPERSYAISSLFLPPEASKSWAGLPAERRRLSGVRMMESANPEEEAQSIALLVREALEQPEQRIAVVTPDRGLAARIVQHLRRWNIEADDSAGQPLSQTTAGRAFLLLAEVAAERAAPVPLIALLEHPHACSGEGRPAWLEAVRKFELRLRGPRREPGLEPLDAVAEKALVQPWWEGVTSILGPLLEPGKDTLADLLDGLIAAAEALCGEVIWSREDGRALSSFIDDLRLHAREVGSRLEVEDLPSVLRDAMDRIAVRPSYGGHSRVAVYGLLESRMTRAELVVCAGLNEGVWPGTPASDPLLAPAVLRALGVPGADFRIGLSAHDLAGLLGAPQVVLSRSLRDAEGPAIASRFWLRVQALLGVGERLLESHQELAIPALARRLDIGDTAPAYPKPQPMPSADQRNVRVSVTALDRLRSDPYQFYASSIMRLPELDSLDAEPSPAWQGELAHKILERWHNKEGTLDFLANDELTKMDAHPLMRALWRPRLMKALEWVEIRLAANPQRVPTVVEEKSSIEIRGVKITGKADRIDRLGDGTLAIVDYKTGSPPTTKAVAQGFAMQLGTLGLMVREGAWDKACGEPVVFEYWSLRANKESETGFGLIKTPVSAKGIALADFLPKAEEFLHQALDDWILGDQPFTARLNPAAPGYATYDHLMRLDEWMGRE